MAALQQSDPMRGAVAQAVVQPHPRRELAHHRALGPPPVEA
jgi:hypothetical protein